MYYSIVFLTKMQTMSRHPPARGSTFRWRHRGPTPHDYLQKIPKMKKK